MAINERGIGQRSELRTHFPEVSGSERNFWKGSDLKTLEKVRLLTGGESRVRFIVGENALPKNGEDHVLDGLQVSMRSRAAQLGLEVIDWLPDQFENELEFTSDGLPVMNVVLQNHLSRPIFIPENSGVFRFHTDGMQHAISEKDLYSLIGNKENNVSIDGKEGEDWDFHVNPQTGRVDGVYLRIDKDNRKWIKPDFNVVDFPNKEGEYRSLVDRYYTDISEADPEEQILWIGETVRLNLPEGIEAILSSEAKTEMTGGVTGRHIDSRLIDGGRTSWKIRTEVISKTTESEMPNFVIAYFVRS